MNTKHLKAKILDLAIRGKLVSQDPSEGNATDLLKKVKKDKKSSFIIKGDDGRHYEQFADGTLKDIEDEIPFEIPDSWCWCKINTICNVVMGSSPEGSSISDKPNGMEFHQGKIYFTDKYLQKGNSFTSHITKIAPINSLLLCVRAPVGTVNITKREICIGRGLCSIIPQYAICPDFWFYWMQCLKADFEQNATGTTFKAISVDVVKNQFVPLPPLAEQERIVSAIEKAFEQIDIIEKNKLNLKNYIKQTKSKVLDLAIHGKLVEQNSQEGNAFELLEKIRNEKAEQVKQKKIKADKSASFIIKAEDGRHYEQFADGTLKDIEEEIPFEIPDSWCWCRLRNIGIYKKGPFGSALTKSMFVPKSDSTVKVYEQQNAIKKNHELGHYYIQSEYFESDMKGFEVHPGDVLVSCAGTIGETYILPENIERGIINQALMKMTISKELNIQFFLTYFDHILKTASDESGKGTAMKNIPPFDVFKQFLFPLPPLAEQQRIVAKIEQIFAHLDALEKSLGE